LLYFAPCSNPACMYVLTLYSYQSDVGEVCHFDRHVCVCPDAGVSQGEVWRKSPADVPRALPRPGCVSPCAVLVLCSVHQREACHGATASRVLAVKFKFEPQAVCCACEASNLAATSRGSIRPRHPAPVGNAMRPYSLVREKKEGGALNAQRFAANNEPPFSLSRI